MDYIKLAKHLLLKYYPKWAANEDLISDLSIEIWKLSENKPDLRISRRVLSFFVMNFKRNYLIENRLHHGDHSKAKILFPTAYYEAFNLIDNEEEYEYLVSRLTKKEASLLNMRFKQGLIMKEIADKLKVSKQLVSMMLTDLYNKCYSILGEK